MYTKNVFIPKLFKETMKIDELNGFFFCIEVK